RRHAAAHPLGLTAIGRRSAAAALATGRLQRRNASRMRPRQRECSSPARLAQEQHVPARVPTDAIPHALNDTSGTTTTAPIKQLTAKGTLPMLDMRQVTKVYRTELVETHALRSLDLHVKEGEFVAVTGPSGS